MMSYSYDAALATPIDLSQLEAEYQELLQSRERVRGAEAGAVLRPNIDPVAAPEER